jgi:hypothetical protein
MGLKIKCKCIKKYWYYLDSTQCRFFEEWLIFFVNFVKNIRLRFPDNKSEDKSETNK